MTYRDSVVQLIGDYSCRRVAEVGVLRAVLAKAVQEACQLEAYYLIDPWKPYSGIGAGKLVEITNWEDICHRVYSYFWKYDEVHIVRLESVRAAKLFEPESLGLVFLDGDHSYETVLEDIQAWLPIARKVLAGHDYGVFPGVKKAVDESLSGIRHLPGSVWYIEKEK